MLLFFSFNFIVVVVSLSTCGHNTASEIIIGRRFLTVFLVCFGSVVCVMYAVFAVCLLCVCCAYVYAAIKPHRPHNI